MEVVLGTHIGTSSTKGLLVTPDGQIVESAQRAHQISLPRPGWAEVGGRSHPAAQPRSSVPRGIRGYCLRHSAHSRSLRRIRDRCHQNGSRRRWRDSPLWTSILSDVTGRAQLIPRQTIGACYGGALLAAIGTGIVEPKTDWTVIDHKVEPDPIRRARYDELYQLWGELYPAARDQTHRLGAWAKH